MNFKLLNKLINTYWIESRIFKIILQPSLISFLEIVRGGVILTALFSMRSQNRIYPWSFASKTNLLAISALVIIKQSIKPTPLISLISLWFNFFWILFLFLLIVRIVLYLIQFLMFEELQPLSRGCLQMLLCAPGWDLCVGYPLIF